MPTFGAICLVVFIPCVGLAQSQAVGNWHVIDPASRTSCGRICAGICCTRRFAGYRTLLCRNTLPTTIAR